MRQSWTDDRLDDLSHRMDERFDRVDDDIREVRDEMARMESRLRAQANEHYVRVREEIASLHNDNRQLLGEMQALQRTIIQIGWTGAITLIVALAGVLITHL